MKFLAVEIPTENWDHMDWIYDLFEDGGRNKAYLVEAKDYDEARRLVFDEIYEDISDKINLAKCQILDLSMDDCDDEVMSVYGEKDGKIILDIIYDYIKWEEAGKNTADFPNPYDRVCRLSDDSIKELCYNNLICNIGLVEIEKELRGKKR